MYLSGLYAASARPRALVIALHGGGQHAGYFHDPSKPQRSLLLLGSLLDYAVLALDRPGYGASVDIAQENLTLAGQADAIWRALLEDSQFISVPMMLAGHSFGAMVAMQMAGSRPDGVSLLGTDVSGIGTRYADAVYAKNSATYESPSPLPAIEPGEAIDWPARVEAIAGAVTGPVSVTVGQHDQTWINPPEELGALFVGAESTSVHVQPLSGHNVSTGRAARSYHLRLFAFLTDCLLRQ
jgi:Alpha/beta hydrolase family